MSEQNGHNLSGHKPIAATRSAAKLLYVHACVTLRFYCIYKHVVALNMTTKSATLCKISGCVYSSFPGDKVLLPWQPLIISIQNNRREFHVDSNFSGFLAIKGQSSTQWSTEIAFCLRLMFLYKHLHKHCTFLAVKELVAVLPCINLNLFVH